MSWTKHRFAPAIGERLCRIDAVPDGGCKELRYGQGDGYFGLLLYRSGERLRAYVNSCPHFSVPLNARPDQFILMSKERIMCAFHSAVFSLDSGRCESGPAEGMGLEPVPVNVVDEHIYLGAS